MRQIRQKRQAAATKDAAAAGVPASARTVLKLLQRLRHGSLTLHFPDGQMQRFGGEALPHATLHLNNWNVFSAALKSGDIGFAESFIAGDWTTPDLTALLRVLVQNRAEVEQVIFGSWWGQLAYRVKHWLNRNTRANSQKNIHAHYDLGNAFYTRWLDPSMNYSSALFAGNLQQSLQQAQTANFPSMVQTAEAVTLADIRAVDTRFPLRGEFELRDADGNTTTQQGGPEAGTLWLSGDAARKLNVRIGDAVGVGNLQLRYAATLIKEPDAALDYFNVAPKVLIAYADLSASGLVQNGSRIQYRMVVAGDDGTVTQFTAQQGKNLKRGRRLYRAGQHPHPRHHQLRGQCRIHRPADERRARQGGHAGHGQGGDSGGSRRLPDPCTCQRLHEVGGGAGPHPGRQTPGD